MVSVFMQGQKYKNRSGLTKRVSAAKNSQIQKGGTKAMADKVLENNQVSVTGVVDSEFTYSPRGPLGKAFICWRLL